MLKLQQDLKDADRRLLTYQVDIQQLRWADDAHAQLKRDMTELKDSTKLLLQRMHGLEASVQREMQYIRNTVVQLHSAFDNNMRSMEQAKLDTHDLNEPVTAIVEEARDGMAALVRSAVDEVKEFQQVASDRQVETQAAMQQSISDIRTQLTAFVDELRRGVSSTQVTAVPPVAELQQQIDVYAAPIPPLPLSTSLPLAPYPLPLMNLYGIHQYHQQLQNMSIQHQHMMQQFQQLSGQPGQPRNPQQQ